MLVQSPLVTVIMPALVSVHYYVIDQVIIHAKPLFVLGKWKLGTIFLLNKMVKKINILLFYLSLRL